MDMIQAMKDAGFDRITVLDGAECGIEEPTLLIAFRYYQAESRDEQAEVWIHPYYYASQAAYLAAKRLTEQFSVLHSRDEIRVKPIFARIQWLTQGRNTISYLPEQGSRFHVQIFTCDEHLEATDHLLPAAKDLHCGTCTKCFEVCPTHAIDSKGFHRERCIRNWQMNGKEIPIEVREKMGNRLIGCDSCQLQCPHNRIPEIVSETSVTLDQLLCDTQEACEILKPLIGANLAIRNRVLSQAVVMAGCRGDGKYREQLQQLTHHPSPVISAHAEWAEKHDLL